MNSDMNNVLAEENARLRQQLEDLKVSNIISVLKKRHVNMLKISSLGLWDRLKGQKKKTIIS